MEMSENMKSYLKKRIGNQTGMLLLVILLICIIAGTLNSSFLTFKNFTTVLQQISVLGIIAMAMLLLMIFRGIDLSLGALMGMSGVILCKIVMAGYSVFYGVLLSMAITTICGFVNGVIVTKSKSEPLIITLGMSYIYSGLALVISDGGFLSFGGNLKWFGRGYILKIPVAVYILLFIMIFIHVILTYTKYGRRLFLIGANEELAYLSGIKVDRCKIISYMISGILTGIAMIVLVARLGNILAGSGDGYEFRALSAAIVGGVTFSGAKGTVFGVFLGVVLLGIMSNAMNILGVSSFYQTVISGVIIVVAVILSNLNNKKRSSI